MCDVSNDHSGKSVNFHTQLNSKKKSFHTDHDMFEILNEFSGKLSNNQ